MFLCSEVGLSGGMNVIFHHAANLARYFKHDVTVATRVEGDFSWIGDRAKLISVKSYDEVAGVEFDVAIATFWETLFDLRVVTAKHSIWFCQSLEDRFYPLGHPYVEVAAAAIQVPVPTITEATWIKKLLNSFDVNRPIELVLNGIDKSIFSPTGRRPRKAGAPLHVLIEGDLASHTKGIKFAVDGALGMKQNAVIRHITRDEFKLPKHPHYEPLVGALSFKEMADQYRWSDVIVKTSRVEGMFGPPLEAFHCGSTAVVTPVTGYDEYIVNGVNGVVVGWDDVHTLSLRLDELATNEVLVAKLQENALETAKNWIDWQESSERFNEALLKLANSLRDYTQIQAELNQLELSKPKIVDGVVIKDTDATNPGSFFINRLLKANYKHWIRKALRNPLKTSRHAFQLSVAYFNLLKK